MAVAKVRPRKQFSEKKATTKRTRKQSSSSSNNNDDDDDEPLNKKLKSNRKNSANKNDDVKDEDIPLGQLEKTKSKTKVISPKEEDIENDNELTLSQIKSNMDKSIPIEKVSSKKPVEKIKKETLDSSDNKSLTENEEESSEYKWWEEDLDDGTEKWQTLEHNGVLFPPVYEPLPDSVRLIYDNKPVKLPVEA